MIGEHLQCAQCGYDLFGADYAGVCPECGTPVQRSRDIGLDLDVIWQRQLERALRLSLVATIAWAVCFAMAIAAWAYEPIEAGLAVTAVVAITFDVRAGLLLWRVPPGRRPLIRRRQIQLGRATGVLAALGLAGLGAAPLFGRAAAGWASYFSLVTALGLLLLAIPRWWIAAKQGDTILEHLGSQRLGAALRVLATARTMIELILFGGLLIELILPIATFNDLPLSLVVLVWISVVAYGILQLFAIGCANELYRTVRHYRLANEAA